jgi:hypothetical protein
MITVIVFKYAVGTLFAMSAALLVRSQKKWFTEAQDPS